ncbi:PAS domain S-box protein [Mucilaginibacter arboris]|uniref:histidine kinase n=1 Tax=Mucilaginibacter arboris TaxID=2682090 RepID=A0A7K1SVI6_9SPHI|nr:PAS domain S-box protein [Mucilaginibacter arboris]MVN21335.1 PAS domain S-box protein [Mucilaginibacter arboris]
MTNFNETKNLLENSNFYYVIIAGMDSNYSYVNSHYASAFGYISENMVGKPYYITMHPDDRKVCEETSIKCFQNPDKSFPATIRKHDGKGGYIITQWEYRAIFNDQNEPDGVFCMGYDITEYVRANENLQVAKSEIEEKKTILEQIGWEQSHVIRRPVANIIGLVNILNKMDLDQNMSNICEMLTDSADQLDEAINTIVRKTE